jgi:hypothetical protein
VSVSYGGGILAGVWGSEAQVKPWSVDLRGNLDPVDVEQVGLETFYPDSLEEPAAPTALTISADGARITWVSRNRADGIDVNQHVVIVDRDGSNRHEFTLPVAPTRVYGLTDRGQYLVAGSLGSEPSALVDTETGGLLVLPLAGPAAATGQWTESPQWPIPSSVTEDVTQEIRSQEPQWATGHAGSDYAQALADLLVTNDANSTDECTSTARTFPNTTSGDGPFSIELRQFCDDSVAGAWYDVTLVGPQPDGSITGGATRRTLCWRAVSPDGLCV